MNRIMGLTARLKPWLRAATARRDPSDRLGYSTTSFRGLHTLVLPGTGTPFNADTGAKSRTPSLGAL